MRHTWSRFCSYCSTVLLSFTQLLLVIEAACTLPADTLVCAKLARTACPAPPEKISNGLRVIPFPGESDTLAEYEVSNTSVCLSIPPTLFLGLQNKSCARLPQMFPHAMPRVAHQ